MNIYIIIGVLVLVVFAVFALVQIWRFNSKRGRELYAHHHTDMMGEKSLSLVNESDHKILHQTIIDKQKDALENLKLDANCIAHFEVDNDNEREEELALEYAYDSLTQWMKHNDVFLFIMHTKDASWIAKYGKRIFFVHKGEDLIKSILSGASCNWAAYDYIDDAKATYIMKMHVTNFDSNESVDLYFE